MDGVIIIARAWTICHVLSAGSDGRRPGPAG